MSQPIVLVDARPIRRSPRLSPLSPRSARAARRTDRKLLLAVATAAAKAAGADIAPAAIAPAAARPRSPRRNQNHHANRTATAVTVVNAAHKPGRKRKGQQTDLDAIAPLASKRSRRAEPIQPIDVRVSPPSLPLLLSPSSPPSSSPSPVPHTPLASTSALTLDQLPPEPVLPIPPPVTVISIDENEAGVQSANTAVPPASTPLQDLPLSIDVENSNANQLDLDASPPSPITPPRIPNYFSPLSQSFTSDDVDDSDEDTSLLITPLHPHGSHRHSPRVFSTKRVSPRLWQFACKQRVGMLACQAGTTVHDFFRTYVGNSSGGETPTRPPCTLYSTFSASHMRPYQQRQYDVFSASDSSMDEHDTHYSDSSEFDDDESDEDLSPTTPTSSSPSPFFCADVNMDAAAAAVDHPQHEGEDNASESRPPVDKTDMGNASSATEHHDDAEVVDYEDSYNGDDDDEEENSDEAEESEDPSFVLSFSCPSPPPPSSLPSFQLPPLSTIRVPGLITTAGFCESPGASGLGTPPISVWHHPRPRHMRRRCPGINIGGGGGAGHSAAYCYTSSYDQQQQQRHANDGNVGSGCNNNMDDVDPLRGPELHLPPSPESEMAALPGVGMTPTPTSSPTEEFAAAHDMGFGMAYDGQQAQQHQPSQQQEPTDPWTSAPVTYSQQQQQQQSDMATWAGSQEYTMTGGFVEQQQEAQQPQVQQDRQSQPEAEPQAMNNAWSMSAPQTSPPAVTTTTMDMDVSVNTTMSMDVSSAPVPVPMTLSGASVDVSSVDVVGAVENSMLMGMGMEYKPVVVVDSTSCVVPATAASVVPTTCGTTANSAAIVGAVTTPAAFDVAPPIQDMGINAGAGVGVAGMGLMGYAMG